MSVFQGHDPAWGGWGRCTGTAAGPLEVSHRRLGSDNGLRWAHLATELERLEHTATDHRLEHPGRFRVVVEVAPKVYRTTNRGGGKGNQASTAQGLGQLNGALLLWGTRPGLWDYPWAVEVSEWRAWWSIGGRDRTDRKRNAIAMVRFMGWARFLEPFADDADPKDDYGAMGDVAESILITVGAARHVHQAPRGPVRDPAWRPHL